MVGWLILLPPDVGWDIMGYELEPFLSYLKLRKSSYFITLNYTYYLSTPQVHLPRLGTTISPSVSSRKSSPPRGIVHKWGSRPTFSILSPAASKCTPLWGGLTRLTLAPPPGGILNPNLPQVLPSYPSSAWLPGDGTPTGHLASNLSPPIYHCHTVPPNYPPLYKPSHRPTMLLPYFTAPLRSPPTDSTLYSGSDTPQANRCCYRQFSDLGKERPQTVAGYLH